VAVGLGSAWVGNLDDRTLSRVDLKTRSVERPISLHATPTGIALGFGAIWVAHGLIGTVSRIAPQYVGIETIRPRFTRYATTARGTITRGAGSIWVAYGDSSVSRIDPASRHDHKRENSEPRASYHARPPAEHVRRLLRARRFDRRTIARATAAAGGGPARAALTARDLWGRTAAPPPGLLLSLLVRAGM